MNKILDKIKTNPGQFVTTVIMFTVLILVLIHGDLK